MIDPVLTSLQLEMVSLVNPIKNIANRPPIPINLKILFFTHFDDYASRYAL